MEEPEPMLNLQTLKELTIQAISLCSDPSTVDLIYKILLMA